MLGGRGDQLILGLFANKYPSAGVLTTLAAPRPYARAVIQSGGPHPLRPIVSSVAAQVFDKVYFSAPCHYKSATGNLVTGVESFNTAARVRAGFQPIWARLHLPPLTPPAQLSSM